MRESLAGSRIFLTGASSGIGRALALELAGEGARLHLCGRNGPRLKSAVQACAERGPLPGFSLMDVNQPARVKKAAAEALRRLGEVDILVHCAGGQIAWGSFAAQDPELARIQMETNYLGSLNVIRAFLPHFLERGTGTLVLMGSLTGVIPSPGLTSYGASKFALTGLARGLDLELRSKGLRVLCVLPPNVDTPMLKGVPLPGYPRPLSPEAVAKATILGIREKKALILPGLSAPLALLYRIFPGFVEEQLLRRFLSDSGS